MIIYKVSADGNFYAEFQEGEETARDEEAARQTNAEIVTVTRTFTFLNDPDEREFGTPDERDIARAEYLADHYEDRQSDAVVE